MTSLDREKNGQSQSVKLPTCLCDIIAYLSKSVEHIVFIASEIEWKWIKYLHLLKLDENALKWSKIY